ncbi:MAG: hypothetical protein R6U98_22850 [Pirellulaceae bacterium]
MRLNWIPWRYIVRSIARRYGFVDPLSLMANLSRFGEPAEVAAPIELLRAGAVFHARGLMNTSAIQHNLDWIWPFWVERQFDPKDEAFVPRAFSITHVNLTHRNWTAIGLPDVDVYPIVDPRGLLTPHWDGWSIDGWIFAADGTRLFPSRCPASHQYLDFSQGLAVTTEVEGGAHWLRARAEVMGDAARPVCRQTWVAESRQPAWLAIALRPFNPEGVSFVYDVQWNTKEGGWTVDRDGWVGFSEPPERSLMSGYRRGDVSLFVPDGVESRSVQCRAGMATAAALYRLEPGQGRELQVSVPLTRAPSLGRSRRPAITSTRPPVETSAEAKPGSWQDALFGQAQLDVPDARMQQLYRAAVRMLVLLTPGDVFPGPFTYKRFWVRDAAFLLHALLCAGLHERVRRALPQLLSTQRRNGFFHSQAGEWDANGAALWTLHRYCQLTGDSPPPEWRRALTRGGQWIINKRVREPKSAAHAGLLPPGFSAEHLGANDWYYWDDFWAVGGLRGAAELLGRLGDHKSSGRFRDEAEDLLAAIERSLEMTASRRPRVGIPASPYRRMDAGAVGSLAGSYPLRILPPRDPRIADTVAFLRECCFVEEGFFQDMIHSGINPYLTLHVAQVLLRDGDPGWFDLAETVAGLASPTGQWPEAVHPRTGGGCMGDGQHMWAAAEWVLAIRNAFVREEDDRIIIGSGLPAAWLKSGRKISFGPAPTRWGKITVSLEPVSQGMSVRWHASWRDSPPPIDIRLLGFEPANAAGKHGTLTVAKTP